MKITSVYTVECCKNFKISVEHEHEAIDQLLDHIEQAHVRKFAKLSNRGRKLARSQNGFGYFDRGNPENDGWHNAQPTFRRAWTESALKEALKK